MRHLQAYESPLVSVVKRAANGGVTLKFERHDDGTAKVLATRLYATESGTTRSATAHAIVNFASSDDHIAGSLSRVVEQVMKRANGERRED